MGWFLPWLRPELDGIGIDRRAACVWSDLRLNDRQSLLQSVGCPLSTVEAVGEAFHSCTQNCFSARKSPLRANGGVLSPLPFFSGKIPRLIASRPCFSALYEWRRSIMANVVMLFFRPRYEPAVDRRRTSIVLESGSALAEQRPHASCFLFSTICVWKAWHSQRSVTDMDTHTHTHTRTHARACAVPPTHSPT